MPPIVHVLTRRSRTAVGFAGGLALVLALGFAGRPQPAAADILVLRDGGATVQTAGAWEVDGSQVRFTTRQGRLSSLPLADIDLEASREATDKAKARAVARSDAGAGEDGRAKPSTDKKAPVMTLTQRDVARASDDVIAEGEAELKEPDVILYTTSWCGYCRKARSLLESLEVDYVEQDIEKSPAARRAKDRKSPNCGVPVTDVAGTIVCGFNEQRLRRLIEALPSDDASDGADDGTAETDETRTR